MEEGRVVKYGRFLATLVNILIKHESYPMTTQKYKARFIEELKTYSFEPRRKGEPKNLGCVWELKNINNLNLSNPEQFAKFIKEGIHLMYLKPTSKKVIESLVNNL